MNEVTDMQRDARFFGHPKGLQTLFLTEMWERMSYYGMRGILVLFMTAAITDGGLGITAVTATAIYGLYTACVYFMGLPGGWIADRLIGGQRAIWYGGIIIMCGHIILAIPSEKSFFVGLIFVVLGTGLLKPNISALVGELYSSNDERRDSGYALYYMGINIGSLIGYTVCGFLIESESFGWHWAFGAAAVGMGVGLIQYRLTIGNLRGVSENPTKPLTQQGNQKAKLAIIAFIAILVIVTLLTMNGTITIDAPVLAKRVAIAFTVIFFIYYAVIFFSVNSADNPNRGPESKGLLALLLVCIASACFWSGFEQAGSSLNLFANQFTDRNTFLGEIPTVWFQNANPFFIIVLTPFFAALWLKLGQKLVTPAMGIKCAVGLMIMGTGFFVMVKAAEIVAGGSQSPAFYLIMTYFLHTVGELIISPIALSAISKLSPKRVIGQMMGLFVLTYSIGNIIAGVLAGGFDSENTAQLPNLFNQIFLFSVSAGAIILVIAMFTKNWEKEAVDAKE